MAALRCCGLAARATSSRSGLRGQLGLVLVLLQLAGPGRCLTPRAAARPVALASARVRRFPAPLSATPELEDAPGGPPVRQAAVLQPVEQAPAASLADPHVDPAAAGAFAFIMLAFGLLRLKVNGAMQAKDVRPPPQALRGRGGRPGVRAGGRSGATSSCCSPLASAQARLRFEMGLQERRVAALGGDPDNATALVAAEAELRDLRAQEEAARSVTVLGMTLRVMLPDSEDPALRAMEQRSKLAAAARGKRSAASGGW